jgi:hypothetical protein
VLPASTSKKGGHRPKCNPPYTIDAEGIRHVKPDCV